MHALYMNNFRGFTDCTVPLVRTNFLVGENSTGKSSFLQLLAVLTNHLFSWDPALAFAQPLVDLSFDDCVSAAATDRGFFQLGTLTADGRDPKGPTAFLYRFVNAKGSPRVESAIRWQAGVMVEVVYGEDGAARTRVIHTSNALGKVLPAVAFERLQAIEKDSAEPFKVPSADDQKLMIGTSPAQHFFTALPKELKVSPFQDRFLSDNIKWIAPIRPAPKRFYGAGRLVVTPDGEHAPYVLRRLMDGERSAPLVDYLRAFGQASGLYDAIVPHAFSEDPRSPFELLIQFRSVHLTIDNVGYGVSQVLPLLVELLTSKPGTAFFVQQPEVHLHPRAQAALGGLLYELAETFEYSYFIETHSDYLIDRYRLTRKKHPSDRDSDDQIVFFERANTGNAAHAISIAPNGRLDVNQPRAFRDFFIREETSLMDI